MMWRMRIRARLQMVNMAQTGRNDREGGQMGKTKNRKIAELLRKLAEFKKGKGIEKLILFGSAATGGMGKDSDIDLIVVSKEFAGKSTFERGRGFWIEWHMKQKMGYPVDFIFYTPEEFEREKKMVGIVSEALREGIAI